MKAFSENKPNTRGLRRRLSSVAALCSAAFLCFGVYGTVVYNSSADPVVAYSAMKDYVSGELAPIASDIADLSERLAVVELTGGGSGSGSGTGMGGEAAQQLLSRISALESGLAAAQASSAVLQEQLNETRTQLNALISGLQTDIDGLEEELTSVEDSVSSLESALSKTNSNVSTLQSDFKKISDFSTSLNILTQRVNNLTSDSGDISTLKKNVAELTEEYADLLERMGQLYEAVYVPNGATIYAKDADDSLLIVLRTGSAVAVSPYNDPGTAQGLNDLSDGKELYDGDKLSLFHNVLIPRGGTDGRGVKITGIDGAYIMIGGDYVIEEQQ